jgi:hypothetical protein
MDHDGGRTTQWEWAAGRRQFPRVPEVRPSGVRGSMNVHVFPGGQ